MASERRSARERTAPLFGRVAPLFTHVCGTVLTSHLQPKYKARHKGDLKKHTASIHNMNVRWHACEEMIVEVAGSTNRQVACDFRTKLKR